MIISNKYYPSTFRCAVWVFFVASMGKWSGQLAQCGYACFWRSFFIYSSLDFTRGAEFGSIFSHDACVPFSSCNPKLSISSVTFLIVIGPGRAWWQCLGLMIRIENLFRRPQLKVRALRRNHICASILGKVITFEVNTSSTTPFSEASLFLSFHLFCYCIQVV